MARTDYLVLRVAENGRDWTAIDKVSAATPDKAIEIATEHLTNSGLTHSEVLGFWGAVPIAHFHWRNQVEDRSLRLEVIEISPPNGQTQLPTDDPPKKKKPA